MGESQIKKASQTWKALVEQHKFKGHFLLTTFDPY